MRNKKIEKEVKIEKRKDEKEVGKEENKRKQRTSCPDGETREGDK